MAEELLVNKSLSKEEKYKQLIPQIKALVFGENDEIANLSNIMSALKYGMGFFWVGVYFNKNEELVLGPFQGPIACTRIKKGKGVCGTSFQNNETIIVPNVDEFPGHIACSSSSKSEIVLPIVKNNEVYLVLDIDSEKLNDFDETDKKYLTQIAEIIEEII